jgi:hypothetical protein
MALLFLNGPPKTLVHALDCRFGISESEAAVEIDALLEGGSMAIHWHGAYLARSGVALALLALAGCSSDDGRLPVVPVTGSVTYKGQPVADAQVIFLNRENNRPAATANTGVDGSFRLSTYEEGDGATPGNYWVTVSKLKGAAPSDPNAPFDPVADMKAAERSGAPTPAAQNLLPEKYSKAGQHSLGFTVDAKGSNHFPIELTD